MNKRFHRLAKQVVELSGIAIHQEDGYHFVQQIKGTRKVVVLPYKMDGAGGYQYLLRSEPVSAWGKGLHPIAIIGSVEDGEDLAESAARECLEESGIKIDPSELQYFGIARPCKSIRQVNSLFAVDVTNKKQKEPDGDADETHASVAWVSYSQALASTDPNIGLILARLQLDLRRQNLNR